MMTTNLMDVPFNKLVLWQGNVRKTGVEAGLEELAASIAAHGLLNPLTVRKAPKGRFAVIAGQRRYLAVKRLVESGAMDKAAPISCTVRAGTEDAGELSLAENVVRVAMHPADQFEAWRDLIEKGTDVAGIALRFGVAESTVRRRLALARVSPKIFARFREEVIGLEALQAFTVTDDHALQEQVWEGLSEWQRDDARAIRRALTVSDVPCHDRRVRFVGMEAYQAAGGSVRRDLFDSEDGGTLQDASLLERLALEKLQAVAADLQAEGWKWTEARLVFGWEERRAFLRGEPEQLELPEAEQAEADRLQEELEGLTEAEREEEEQAAAWDRIEALEARLAEIDATRWVWSEAVKAVAGAVVSVGHDGSVEIERGLIRAEDAGALKGNHQPEGGEGRERSAKEKSVAEGLPASLIEDLSGHKTAALRIELARAPEKALALVVHALASSAFYQRRDGLLKLSLTTRSLKPSIREHDASPAVAALAGERERIVGMLPASHGDLWGWCFEAASETLLDVMAVAGAHGVDAVVGKTDPNREAAAQGVALANALALAMGSWYRPTAEGYFNRISKDAILADLTAARQAPPAPAWLKMKKGELAALAETKVAATGWLPSPLQ